MLAKKKITENKKSRISWIASAAVCLAGCLYAAVPFAFADAGAVINSVVQIVCMICNVIGIIFAILGIVRLAIAHANEDGPAMQKAAVMIASGIILIVLGATKILGIDFASWLTTA